MSTKYNSIPRDYEEDHENIINNSDDYNLEMGFNYEYETDPGDKNCDKNSSAYRRETDSGYNNRDMNSSDSGHKTGPSVNSVDINASGNGRKTGPSVNSVDRNSSGNGRTTGPGVYSNDRNSSGNGRTTGPSVNSVDRNSSGNGRTTGPGVYSNDRNSSGNGRKTGPSVNSVDINASGNGRTTGPGVYSNDRNSSGDGRKTGPSVNSVDINASGNGRNTGPSVYSNDRNSSGNGHKTGPSVNSRDRNSRGMGRETNVNNLGINRDCYGLKPNPAIKIITVNCLSLKNKKKQIDFQEKMSEIKPHIVLGQESWLTNNDKDKDVFPSGYKVYRKDRENKTGGGVFILVSEEIGRSEQKFQATIMSETIWVLIKPSAKKHFYVCCAYRPDKDIHCIDEIRRILDDHSDETIVIGGDFNLGSINWGPPITIDARTRHKVGECKKLCELVDKYGLTQEVNEPTRVTQKTSTLIDLILTNVTRLVNKREVLDGISDHRIPCIHITLESNNEPCKNSAEMIPPFKDASELVIENKICYRGDTTTTETTVSDQELTRPVIIQRNVSERDSDNNGGKPMLQIKQDSSFDDDDNDAQTETGDDKREIKQVENTTINVKPAEGQNEEVKEEPSVTQQKETDSAKSKNEKRDINRSAVEKPIPTHDKKENLAAKEQKLKEREKERRMREIRIKEREEKEGGNPTIERKWDKDKKLHKDLDRTIQKSRSRSPREQRSFGLSSPSKERRRNNRDGRSADRTELLVKKKAEKKEDEPPRMEDLFKKTKTQPCIDRLPLTEAQTSEEAKARITRPAQRQKHEGDRVSPMRDIHRGSGYDRETNRSTGSPPRRRLSQEADHNRDGRQQSTYYRHRPSSPYQHRRTRSPDSHSRPGSQNLRHKLGSKDLRHKLDSEDLRYRLDSKDLRYKLNSKDLRYKRDS